MTSDLISRPPLDRPGEQIRLLRIDDNHLADPSEPLRCHLSVHNIKDVKFKYVAISYCWGPPDQLAKILVDGQPCNVRYNCCYALSQMQRHKPARLYWIDSICINQQSHLEKQHQVGQMGSIFASARMVAACLGLPGDDDILFQDCELAAHVDELSSALDAFQQLPYFRRLWIVQECLLARELQVFHGTSRTRWQDLWIRYSELRFRTTNGPILRSNGELLEAFVQSTYSPTETYDKAEFSQAHSDANNQSADSHGHHIWDIILQHGMRECYDPRDKIYGLLSLTYQEMREKMPINYEDSLLDVLISYARICGARVCEKIFVTSRQRMLRIEAVKKSMRLLAREFISPEFEADMRAHLDVHGLTDALFSSRRPKLSVTRIVWTGSDELVPIDQDHTPSWTTALLLNTKPCAQECRACRELLQLGQNSDLDLQEDSIIMAVPDIKRGRFAILEAQWKHVNRPLLLWQSSQSHHVQYAHVDCERTAETLIPFFKDDDPAEYPQFVGTLPWVCSRKRAVGLGTIERSGSEPLPLYPEELVAVTLLELANELDLAPEILQSRHCQDSAMWHLLKKHSTKIDWSYRTRRQARLEAASP